ncbi:nucleotidyltransferase domain-containing protein, partial [Marinobacter sp. 1Y8]
MFNCDIASVDLTPLPILPSEVATDSSPLSAKNVTDKNLLGIPEWLAQINDDISRSLERGTNIRQLVAARACAIDSLLIALFKWFELDKTDLAFFATGGYGRGELSLYSDIDILLLSPGEIGADASSKIDKLVALLWDIGLEPALSVRSVNDALEAALDHTIASAQLEARLLIGNEALQDMPAQ